ncbi:dolichyldiphosphatase [Saccharomycopsis crataegensis]|uniref:Dolichyldiphosphatase n=1 Tax=Saccharomycopsis crataegensis TaxID=43959 RepID=A0AAV5QGL3_9ASCO|nr:dolichyldiphosphatase [Saccharomycopsis crataegensis]
MLDTHHIVPFDETYILYDPSDPLSLVCVIFSLLPIGVLIFYFTWFITSRELEPVFLAFGQVCNNVINYVVKRLVKSPRPLSLYQYTEFPELQNDYGMPSAHSQFMGYFATYVFLRLLLQNTNLKTLRGRLFCGILLYSACCLTAFSRVYLLYHEVDQVVIGVLVGSVIGAAYFIVVSFVRDIGLIEWGLNLWFVKCWYIKDSYYCAMSYEEEYQLYLERKKKARPGVIQTSKKLN